MTGNLKVTPEKMLSISSQFGSVGSEVQNLTQQMLDIVNQLNTTWSGDAATGFYNKLKGLQGDMQKVFKLIQEHCTDLNDMAKTYQQAEKDNLTTANSLKTSGIV